MADTPTRGSSRAVRTPLKLTPSQRTPSAAGDNRRGVHTPLDRSGRRELANSVRRGLGTTSGRRNQATTTTTAILTPHAAAARRALEQRRAAMFTPGKDRRRSMREQHQTPMNLLNQLARRLAPSTQQVFASSSPAANNNNNNNAEPVRTLPEIREDDDDDDDDYMDESPGAQGRYDEDDEQLPPLPRLSLPLQDDGDDDDTAELLPPRMSEIPDDIRTAHTVRSVELPRDRPQSRYSRGSFGSVAASDYTEMDDQTMNMTGRSSDFFTGELRFDLGREADDTTMGIERIDNDATMRTAGRVSEFSLSVPLDMGDQTSFIMSEPGDAASATSILPADVSVSAATATATAAARPPDTEDTYANISFIPREPPPPAGDDDDAAAAVASDNERDVMMDFDDADPSAIRLDAQEAHDNEAETAATARLAAAVETEIDTETGRRRTQSMADAETTFLSDGDDSVAAAPTTRSKPDDSSSKPDDSSTRKTTTTTTTTKKNKKKQKRVSRHETEYPPLPPSFVRRVAHRAVQTSGLGLANQRISADVLVALTQASDWFFEQLGDDLGAYADHAQRTVIEESDVVTLMKRQRQIGSDATLFSLAQRHLPRELLQQLRMPVPTEFKDGPNKSLSRYNDEDEDEDSSE